jgi:AraC family transcriptional regulator
MNDRRSELLFASALVRVFDVACHAPRSGYSGEEWCRVAQIVVPRRGVFMVLRRGARTVVDSNTALVFGADDTYHVSHPVDGGDQCTVLVFRPELVEEALGNIEARDGTLQAATQLAVHMLTATMAAGVIDRLEAEEGAASVLSALATDLGSSPSFGWHRVSEFQHRRVEEVRAILASQPTDVWHLDSIARTVYCSPFHLARQFRAITGESIARYLLRLRLALALDRIAQGETDLASLAVELGFAHHSHFSARFRSVFGMTPLAVRNTLTRHRAEKMSKIVTAKSRT